MSDTNFERDYLMDGFDQHVFLLMFLEHQQYSVECLLGL